MPPRCAPTSSGPRSYSDRVPRSRPGSHAARRRGESRRPVVFVAGALAVCVAAVAIAALLKRGGDDGPAVAVGTTSPTTAPGSPRTDAATAPTVPPTVAPTVPPTVPPTQPDPGSLPQTEDKPNPSSATFQDHVRALWQAIVSDDPAVARSAFFPLGAYRQVKAISNPDGDYTSRLIAAYDEDIHALHAKLGSQAAGAQLTGIDVPDSQAVWVLPGAEYNKGSYWRVYGANLRYTMPDGRSGAFPIASMISWRGEWYVVHLNSIR